jgi:hypothetical protein
MMNGLPYSPGRNWRKIIGEPNFIFTNIATVIIVGLRQIKPMMEKNKSKIRLTIV